MVAAHRLGDAKQARHLLEHALAYGTEAEQDLLVQVVIGNATPAEVLESVLNVWRRRVEQA